MVKRERMVWEIVVAIEAHERTQAENNKKERMECERAILANTILTCCQNEMIDSQTPRSEKHYRKSYIALRVACMVVVIDTAYSLIESSKMRAIHAFVRCSAAFVFGVFDDLYIFDALCWSHTYVST